MSNKKLYDKISLSELTKSELDELKSDYSEFQANDTYRYIFILSAVAFIGLCILVLEILFLTPLINFEGHNKVFVPLYILFIFIICVVGCIFCGIKEKNRRKIVTKFKNKYSNALISDYRWNYIYTYEQKARASRMAIAGLGGNAASYSGETSGAQSSVIKTSAAKTILNGYGFGESYYVNSFNEIVNSSTGNRTQFKMIGTTICLVSDSRSVGWLHSGGAVNYANDYAGEKPFASWESK